MAFRDSIHPLQRLERGRLHSGATVMNVPCTIFFFEDDESFAKEITDYLQSPPVKPDDPGITVTHYKHAPDAINAIDGWSQDSRPHAALLDLSQRDYTEAGLHICKKIKRNYPDVPVVFLSYHASLRDQNRAFDTDIDADGYLSKSLREEPDYKEHVRTVLLSKIRNIERLRNHEPGVYETGSLKVNVDDSRIMWRGKSVNLQNNTDFGILVDLTKPGNCGKTRHYLQLLRAGSMTAGDREQLRSNVRKRIQYIRRAFAAVDPNFESAWNKEHHGILSDLGKGYLWKQDA